MACVSAGLLEKEAEGSPEPQNISRIMKSRKLQVAKTLQPPKRAHPTLGPDTSPHMPMPTSIRSNSLVVEETDFPMSTKERWMGFLVW